MARTDEQGGPDGVGFTREPGAQPRPGVVADGQSIVAIPPPPPVTPADLRDAGLRAEAAVLSGTTDAMGRDVRYETLKAEVDALQVQVMRQQVPWYRDASSLVAILALLFSFGTTVVSYQRTAQEDVHASEIELRSLISRLAAIPVEMTETARAHADDPGAVASLLSILTQEQILVAKQAAQVLGGIPKERVTAAQYLLVGNVLIGNGIDDPGLELIQDGIETARDVNDYVSGVRVKAFRLFQLGEIEEGRGLYQSALTVFDRKGFDSKDDNFKAYTHMQTQVGWAQAELGVGNCAEARQHLDAARMFAARFPPQDNQVRRMEAVAEALATCRPGATLPPASPTPGLP